ncbi:uncharacterized protein LOC143328020 isoform X2 [Chaetodon auriga]|uniref:uncharacterized protein LOC143328020 isoform X2 n=1 Tax=Chaetodon auriga TaxID=39042 RepID=UPI0040329251
MKMAGFWPGTVLLLAALSSAQAEEFRKPQPSYYEIGHHLTLDVRPTGSEPVTSILWKYNSDLLAEWVKDYVPLVFYDKFKDRATLDLATGRLVVMKMSEADSGEYTVEINNKVPGQRYVAKAIGRVPEPSVWIKPVGCNPSLLSCTLSCDGNTSNAEPVTFSWKKEDEEWEKLDRDINITKSETAHVKTFSCRMENPVSKEDSDPIDNPLFLKETPGVSIDDVIQGVLITALLLGIGSVGGFVYVKRNQITNLFQGYRSSPNNTGPPGKESSGGHLLSGVQSNSDGQPSPPEQPSSVVESPPVGQPPLDGQPSSDVQAPPVGQPPPDGQLPSNGQLPPGGKASMLPEEIPLNTPEAMTDDTGTA